MPHQCTSCARQFADGSKEMLSGCPDCGGTKFQFMPNGGAPAAEEPPSPPDRGTGTVTETVGHVATKLRDFVGDDPEPPTPRSADDAGGGATAATATRMENGADTSSDVTDTAPFSDVADSAPSSDVTDTTSSSDVTDTTSSSDVTDDRGDAVTDGPSGSATVETSAGSDGSSSGSLDEEEVDEPDASDSESATAPEDGAQSTARSQMVSPEELPDGPAYVGTERDGDRQPTTDDGLESRTDYGPETSTDDGLEPTVDQDEEPEGRVVGTPVDESPDLADLREELNDQFEGIRITEPGQYELNLMELYEREETIIALQENGRYVIEPPESWRGDEED